MRPRCCCLLCFVGRLSGATASPRRSSRRRASANRRPAKRLGAVVVDLPARDDDAAHAELDQLDRDARSQLRPPLEALLPGLVLGCRIDLAEVAAIDEKYGGADGQLRQLGRAPSTTPLPRTTPVPPLIPSAARHSIVDDAMGGDVNDFPRLPQELLENLAQGSPRPLTSSVTSWLCFVEPKRSAMALASASAPGSLEIPAWAPRRDRR